MKQWWSWLIVGLWLCSSVGTSLAAAPPPYLTYQGHLYDAAGHYVLTVHHIDGDRAHNGDDNLVALCQRCHLALHARKLVGQLRLGFAWPAWWRTRQPPAARDQEENDADAKWD